jgi:uncharacterized protein with FMN-binding domain
MTTRGITTRLGLAVASTMLAAVLLLGFQAPDDGTLGRTTGSDPQVVAGSTGGSAPTSAGGSRPSPTGSSTSSTTVVDGPVVSTRFGPVQVEIKISNGRIVTITALELPTGGHSGRISNAVEPILASETLSAQSASIDIVSGATYTSTAYQRSLQAALDQAGI